MVDLFTDEKIAIFREELTLVSVGAGVAMEDGIFGAFGNEDYEFGFIIIIYSIEDHVENIFDFSSFRNDGNLNGFTFICIFDDAFHPGFVSF